MALVEAYAKAQRPVAPAGRRPRLRRGARAGPRRRWSRASPARAGRRTGSRWATCGDSFRGRLPARRRRRPTATPTPVDRRGAARLRGTTVAGTGSVAIAAITSCTNTSNPSVMVGARACWPATPWRAACGRAHGQDQPRPRLARRHRVPAGRGPARAAGAARLRRRGLRLHHLHRQLRARSTSRSPRRSRSTTWSWRRSSRATATSRAASTRSCGRATSPRRRWWSRSRSPAAWTST